MAHTAHFRHEWVSLNRGVHGVEDIGIADLVEELRAAFVDACQKESDDPILKIVRAIDRGNYRRAGELIADTLRNMKP